MGFASSHLNCHDDRTSLAKNEESRARTACSSLRVPAMSLIYGIRPEFSTPTYMTSNHYKTVKLRLFDIILFSPCRHAFTLPTYISSEEFPMPKSLAGWEYELIGLIMER